MSLSQDREGTSTPLSIPRCRSACPDLVVSWKVPIIPKMPLSLKTYCIKPDPAGGTLFYALRDE